MQTVLDIIRHYNGAGEEDKEMKHECINVNNEKYKVYIDHTSKKWVAEDRSDWIKQYESITNVKYCPWCGAKLDES